MTDQEMLQLVDQIRETAFAVHRFFGPGHFEKVYENALVNRLTKAGFELKQQVPICVKDEDGTVVGEYMADLVVEAELIIELKACECLTQAHECQIMAYLRATKYRHGLLINFGSRKFEIKKSIL
jgi:GxxExxY protein